MKRIYRFEITMEWEAQDPTPGEINSDAIADLLETGMTARDFPAPTWLDCIEVEPPEAGFQALGDPQHRTSKP
jgi:hypothetical protein